MEWAWEWGSLTALITRYVSIKLFSQLLLELVFEVLNALGQESEPPCLRALLTGS